MSLGAISITLKTATLDCLCLNSTYAFQPLTTSACVTPLPVCRLRIRTDGPRNLKGERPAVGAHARHYNFALDQQRRSRPTLRFPGWRVIPTLSDFLVNPVRSKAAGAMLRISNFVERYPKDGIPVTEPTVAYLGYTRAYFIIAFRLQRL